MLSPVKILRKTIVNALINRKTTVNCEVLRLASVPCSLDMEHIIVPAFVSAEIGLIDAFTWVITFDEDLANVVPLVAENAFISVGFTFNSITKTGAKEIRLISDQAAVYGQIITIQYNQALTLNPLQGTNFINVASFTKPVTNNVQQAPIFVSAEVGLIDAYTIDVLFDRALYESRVPDLTDFIIDFGALQDLDGNIYHSVTIGSQIWLIENFKSTKYNNGTSIPYKPLSADWITDTAGAYCWYNNDIANKDDYGALYSWNAVNTGLLAPAGWRVPTKTDLDTLNTFLGGISIAGGKLKEVGLTHWNTPNTGALDTYGFKLLPCGERYGSDGTFHHFGNYSLIWTSTENFDFNPPLAWFFSASYNNDNVYVGPDGKKFGFGVRLIKD